MTTENLTMQCPVCDATMTSEERGAPVQFVMCHKCESVTYLKDGQVDFVEDNTTDEVEDEAEDESDDE